MMASIRVIAVCIIIQLIAGGSAKTERSFELNEERVVAEGPNEESRSFHSVAIHNGVNFGCNGLLTQGKPEISELYKDDGHHKISLNETVLSDLKNKLGLTSTKEAVISSDLPLQSIYPLSLWPARCLEDFQFDFSSEIPSPVNDLARWEVISDSIYSQYVTLLSFIKRVFGIGNTGNNLTPAPVSINSGCQYYGLENVEVGPARTSGPCLQSGGLCYNTKTPRDGGADDTDKGPGAGDQQSIITGESDDTDKGTGAGNPQSIVIGGGGGGGGGTAGSFGGFGGGAHGTGVAVDGSSAIGLYICNSEHITIIFGTPVSPPPEKPVPPKYIGMDEFSIEEVIEGDKRVVSIIGGQDGKSKIFISTDGDASKVDLTVDGTRVTKKKQNGSNRVTKLKVGWSPDGEAILFDTTGKVSKTWALMKVSV